MGARWYLPGIGRFISADTIVPDPANPQSYNRYSYVVNRPLVLVDPLGHSYCTSPDASCEPNPDTPPYEPSLPTFDPNTGPTNLPILDWYPEADAEKAIENAQQVLDWLSNYTGPNWWGEPGTLPTLEQLVAWLLFQEGGTLENYEDLVFMARILRYRLGDGYSAENLAGLTAFFNPNAGVDFNLDDWQELILQAPPERYVNATQQAFSMDNYVPYDDNGNLVLWWWGAWEATGVSQGYIETLAIVARDSDGNTFYDSFYFGNYEQCKAAAYGGC